MTEVPREITCPNVPGKLCPRLKKLQAMYIPDDDPRSFDPDASDPFELTHFEQLPAPNRDTMLYGVLRAEHTVLASSVDCENIRCGVEERIASSRIRRGLADRAKALLGIK